MNFFYLSWRPIAVFAIEPIVHDIRVIQFEAACAAYAEFREKVSQFEPVDWGFLERRIDSIAVAERTEGLFLFEMRFRDSVRADEVAEECAAKVSFLIRSRRGHIHSGDLSPFSRKPAEQLLAIQAHRPVRLPVRLQPDDMLATVVLSFPERTEIHLSVLDSVDALRKLISDEKALLGLLCESQQEVSGRIMP